jgi:glucosamine--fructose-6-phosphate aminotransferase (isomerizing)
MTSLLEEEIASQGSVIRSRASTGQQFAEQAADLLRGPEVNHLVVAARGSSDNAARFAQYLLGEGARLEAGLAAPWLFRHPERAPYLPSAAVLGISQSGSSPDIVRVLAAARAQHRPTIAITADPTSPLAEQADAVIPLLAGDERSVAATKTFLASLHAVVQLVEALAPSAGRRAWLDQLGDMVEELCSSVLADRGRFDPLANATLITTTGRGLDFAAACESALKLRELSGIPAEAFSPPDLIHGPIAALHPSGGMWLINPDDELNVISAQTAPTVIVSSDSTALASAEIPVELPPGLPPWVAAILAVLPAQAAALRLAELRGVTIDAPHGLSKVTRTR